MKKKEMLNKIKELEKRLEVLDFILEHDKKEVKIKQYYDWGWHKEAVYLYNKEIKKCELSDISDYEVIKNESSEIILKSTFLIKSEGCKDYIRYHKIDKATNVCFEIPEPLFVSKEKEKKTKAKNKNANT